MHIDDHAPICDGLCFDDLHGLPDDLARILIARGLVYVTDLAINGRDYSGMIIAGSHGQAENIAFGRGLHEIVVGQAVKTMPEKWD